MSDAATAWRDDAQQRTATTALILGVLNVVCFGPLAGVPAIVLGVRAWSVGWPAQTAVALGVVGSLWWTTAALTFAYPWLVHGGAI